MVSYTRARGESLGIELKSGAMQRAERIVLIGVGTLVAAWFGASPATAHLSTPTVGIALGICGVLSVWTALGRWVDGHRALRAKQPPQVHVLARTPAPITVEHVNIREVG